MGLNPFPRSSQIQENTFKGLAQPGWNVNKHFNGGP